LIVPDVQSSSDRGPQVLYAVRTSGTLSLFIPKPDRLAGTLVQLPLSVTVLSALILLARQIIFVLGRTSVCV